MSNREEVTDVDLDYMTLRAEYAEKTVEQQAFEIQKLNSVLAEFEHLTALLRLWPKFINIVNKNISELEAIKLDLKDKENEFIELHNRYGMKQRDLEDAKRELYRKEHGLRPFIHALEGFLLGSVFTAFICVILFT